MRAYVCVCACRSCDGEGRKDKGGGEKVREVKTVVWMKLSIRMYVCRYLCISRMHVFFPQNMMFRNGSICAMKSATPATQRAAASTASAENPVRHQSPPSAVSATPAT